MPSWKKHDKYIYRAQKKSHLQSDVFYVERNENYEHFVRISNIVTLSLGHKKAGSGRERKELLSF